MKRFKIRRRIYGLLFEYTKQISENRYQFYRLRLYKPYIYDSSGLWRFQTSVSRSELHAGILFLGFGIGIEKGIGSF